MLSQEYVDIVTGDFAKRQRRKKSVGQAYHSLMSAVAKRRVDCVVVWKYDRFARSMHVLVNDLQYFHSLGVEFISYTQNIDTTTPMGRFFYHIIASFAQFEREMIVERVRAGLAHARAKGMILGRQEKDPEAKYRMASLRSEGLSLRQIARREGYSPSGVLKILRKLENTAHDSTC
jgi:DNA invertase Pin-like site-specific DNA recombinase